MCGATVGRDCVNPAERTETKFRRRGIRRMTRALRRGQAAGQHRERRKQDTGSDSPMNPDAAQPAAVWRHAGSGRSKNGRRLRGGGPRCPVRPCMARILEPGTLNSLELFSAAKPCLDLTSIVRPEVAVARTLQSLRWGLSRSAIVAIVNSLLHGTTVW